MQSLKISLPVWALLWLLGCWATVAVASEILVPEMKTPAPADSSRHHLSRTPDGQLLLSWVEKGQEQTYQLRFAVLEAGHWSLPRTVVTVRHKFTKFAAPPVVLGLSDGALAAAWIVHHNETDKPYGGDLYLYFSRSTDGGKSWSDPLQPYSAKARIYGAQLSLAPLENGRLALVWTDQRDEPRFQIRATLIDTKGKPSPEIVLDKDTCSCCETSTVAQGNTLWTAYRDRLPGEVRDIGVVRWSLDGPAQLGIVHNDHWVIAGCPSNGPAIDRRNGLTMVSWFTVVDGMSYVRTAFRPEGGNDFGKPIEVDSNANGYVNALLLEDGSALVAWRDRAGPTEALKLAQVRQDGTVHYRTTVYRGAFPPWPSRHISMVRVKDSVYVAWKDAEQERIRLVKRPIPHLVAMQGALKAK